MWHKMLIQNKYEIIRISKHTFLHLLCNNIFYYFVIANDAVKRNHMLYTMTPRIDFYEYWREKWVFLSAHDPLDTNYAIIKLLFFFIPL